MLLIKHLMVMLALLGGLVACASPQSLEVPTASVTSASTLMRPTSTPQPTLTPTPRPLVEAPADGVPKYAMDINVNYADRRLDVTQVVRLENDSTDPWHELVFSVPPAYQADVFVLHSAAITTAQTHQATTHTLSDGAMLHIALPTVVQPGEAVAANLSFTLWLPQVDPAAWLPMGNFGAGEQLIQVGDWHPTLVPYIAGSGWFTWDFYPVGDPNVYSCADYDVRFRPSPELVIAAPGIHTRERGVDRYQLPRARSFAFLASPEYLVFKTTAGGILVSSYYLPGNAEAAEIVADTASQALELYERLFGPYPYRQAGLVLAQNAYYGAMEYSGLISMSGYAYAAHDGHPLSLLVNLSVHETAHQWWYGVVGNDQVHEPWLDESLAKYSEVLFYEHYYPEIAEDWWVHNINTHVFDGALSRDIYDFPETSAYIRQIYAQGAHFLSELRELIGDEDFFAFLRAYRDYGEGRLVTREDFFYVLQQHSDADLDPLLERYFSPAASE